eukprot:CAMPEP_0177422132 /NCGR_PEP_ID=MMETSP0368-20130122/71168_1 /TAXON_ID=447022 ORGANISM="Scrippsiella hangoei-like, Strain SHHI-4" /NCGR_SAMPLE_ID=MMETSP0368 /ASSEMBLY_ACC=CAM_ASM_000363 /LENGTH=117 /DNA_ID=CAMNT_0018892055 /DNA_START=374 /DNA_END=727 /DNA_ORIENTATION=+
MSPQQPAEQKTSAAIHPHALLSPGRQRQRQTPQKDSKRETLKFAVSAGRATAAPEGGEAPHPQSLLGRNRKSSSTATQRHQQSQPTTNTPLALLLCAPNVPAELNVKANWPSPPSKL